MRLPRLKVAVPFRKVHVSVTVVKVNVVYAGRRRCRRENLEPLLCLVFHFLGSPGQERREFRSSSSSASHFSFTLGSSSLSVERLSRARAVLAGSRSSRCARCWRRGRETVPELRTLPLRASDLPLLL